MKTAAKQPAPSRDPAHTPAAAKARTTNRGHAPVSTTPTPPTHDLEHLADRYGNRALQRLLAVQRTCSCGGTCPHCRAEEEQSLQRCATAPNTPSPNALAQARNIASTPGAPLPDPLRAAFESHFNTDLSPVRIHTDPAAATAARNIHAAAFTTGPHIAFAPGAYQPHTPAGHNTLRHELTHVLQQSRGQVPANYLDTGPTDPLERAADHAAIDSSSKPGTMATGALQRQTESSSSFAAEAALAPESAHTDPLAEALQPRSLTQSFDGAIDNQSLLTELTAIRGWLTHRLGTQEDRAKLRIELERLGALAAERGLEDRFDLTIGDTTHTRLTRDQAEQLLRRPLGILRAQIVTDRSRHAAQARINADSPVVATTLGFLAHLSRKGGIMPQESIWTAPSNALDQAESALMEGRILTAQRLIAIARDAWHAAHDDLHSYIHGVIDTGDTTVTVLQATAVAGSIAASVATGGAAGAGASLLASSSYAAAGAGLYGVAQTGFGQAGEALAGERTEADITAILRRGAVDATTAFAGGLIGGKFTEFFKRGFGSYLANASDDLLREIAEATGEKVTRDVFMTTSQQVLADVLGGAAAAPFTVALQNVLTNLSNGASPTEGVTLDGLSRQMLEEVGTNTVVTLFLAALTRGRAGGNIDIAPAKHGDAGSASPHTQAKPVDSAPIHDTAPTATPDGSVVRHIETQGLVICHSPCQLVRPHLEALRSELTATQYADLRAELASLEARSKALHWTNDPEVASAFGADVEAFMARLNRLSHPEAVNDAAPEAPTSAKTPERLSLNRADMSQLLKRQITTWRDVTLGEMRRLRDAGAITERQFQTTLRGDTSTPKKALIDAMAEYGGKAFARFGDWILPVDPAWAKSGKNTHGGHVGTPHAEYTATMPDSMSVYEFRKLTSEGVLPEHAKTNMSRGAGLSRLDYEARVVN